MKKIIIIAVILLSACEMTPSPAYLKFERARQARFDAENLQRYHYLDDCKRFYSKNWTKVIYDENEGYCIARPLKQVKDYSKEIPIANTAHKKKKSK